MQHRNVDVRLFHRKTTTRISEKIKEYSEEKKLEYSLEKAKDERFRLKWRKHVRRDAQQRVVYNVDRAVLEVSINLCLTITQERNNLFTDVSLYL